ncbi:MAG: NfeD family protein [Oscillospiraceae bacterium]|nr:NfeD family protein [Oscillospiraceae bacterium]
MNWEVIGWFCLMVGFLIVEASCPFHLVSLWFAGGSLLAMIAALLDAGVGLQVGLFAVVSVVLLAALRPFLKKFITPKLVKTNIDAIIGAEGYVTAAIDNLAATGQVKLGGMEWTARSSAGDAIAAGTLVKVDKIEGVKVFVTPVREKVGN